MYPIIRLITTSIRAKKAPMLSSEEACETVFRCLPWDLDLFMEMNNGRILTLYDLGRFNLSTRTGLAKVCKQRKWGFVVAGSTVQYRRRIRLFNKITMRTQIVAFDDKWTYIMQSMWVKGEAKSSILLRTGIVSKEGVVPTDELAKAMGVTDWKPEPTGWVKKWIESEGHRPWPPEKG